jgi:dTDP-4-dehydrorhamnose 3,5-epimerase
MNMVETTLEGVLLFEPQVHSDSRGYFFEIWSEERYGHAGVPRCFVQDNLSLSKRGVLRGLHYQHPYGQGKLITVLEGEVFDVAVDIRAGSPTFGQWVGWRLSNENRRQLFIPPGLAHGFLVLSEHALVSYKCTEYYRPDAEGTILWNDPDLAIEWPVEPRLISEKDRTAKKLGELAPASLPAFKG